MLGLGGGGAKNAAKPSFISYITPEEVGKDELLGKNLRPSLLPGENLLCEANSVLKYIQDDISQQGVFGKLLCTDFKITFLSEETTPADAESPFKNKLLEENDIPLPCVDCIYGVFDEKKKTPLFGPLKNKCPKKLIICCKDLRVFHFGLKYTKEEEAKMIVNGIVHHCLSSKQLKLLFLFSYAEATSNSRGVCEKSETVMFNTMKDWRMELDRTKGNLTYRVSSANECYKISERLPQYFVVPGSVSDTNIEQQKGKGIPIWCWSHHNGCALLKMSCMKEPEENPLQSPKISPESQIFTICNQDTSQQERFEDLAISLPSLQDIQVAYSKFKQLCLIDNTTDFWDSDVKWFSSLENSSWLEIIRQCLKKALEVAESLERKFENVILVEDDCSDLCCVISSLVQIMMDDYYRTKIGFQSLIQKEWIAGCHSFLDRCNHLRRPDKEEVPVFLLFLECVWQTLQQYSPAFEFTETYLTVLSDSLYIPVFSTFFFNSQHQRDSNLAVRHLKSQCKGTKPLHYPTIWEWSLQFDLRCQEVFNNPLYSEKPTTAKLQQKQHRPKHQRHLSLPIMPSKPPTKKGFFREEADHFKSFLGRRLSKLINSPEEPQNELKKFYDSWVSKPVEYHGLLLPCIEGPAVKVWVQRYLRWVSEAQILGGGALTAMSKVFELMEEIQGLQRELEQQQELVPLSPTLRGNIYLSLSSSTHLSSCFPFASLRKRSFRPVIPRNTLKSFGSVEDLASREDEYIDVGDH
ncbi:myotubularin-related protein 12 [Protopterus annectens]|uniref:myotubularin-related protein 12 n=1 Tax=Protopterus annectens TaxID=7888 RepID=UPI001CF943A4|nr:myotubularin-related protein 12 [Protopterus annectens]